MKKESIVNPKYKSKDSSLLYKYYAGFSDQFVLDTLSYSDLHEMTVLDPWNGSGTTSRIASQLGARKIVGLDINP
ncbi:site-specific DNA-methyltransferase, partial [Listeria welshimeri]|nr:site-specific DNA-methyltransferase [Listeria welshimeri]